MSNKGAILSALARSSYTGLRRWAERRTACSEEAADITQEAFARVSAHADFAAIANLRAFLYKSASHLITDEARKRELLVVDPAVDLDDLPAEDLSLDLRLDIERRCERLVEALTELPG